MTIAACVLVVVVTAVVGKVTFRVLGLDAPPAPKMTNGRIVRVGRKCGLER
jgi:hypothetical protein